MSKKKSNRWSDIRKREAVRRSPTPIYDELMDEFFPVELEFDIPSEYAFALRTTAYLLGVPVELLLQDIVSDAAHRVIREHS